MFVRTKVILVAVPANDTFCGGTWMVGSVVGHGWLVLWWYMGHGMVGSVVVHGTWDGWFSGETWDGLFCGGTWDMGWLVLWWYMAWMVIGWFVLCCRTC